MAMGDLTRIGTNFNANQALISLKTVNGNIANTQSKLATGKRINSTEEDPAGYKIGNTLSSRKRGLRVALDNIQTAKNILNIAEGGYMGQMELLQRIKEKATQAADGSMNTEQRTSIHNQMVALMSEFDNIEVQTTFNRMVLFNPEPIIFQVGERSNEQIAFSLSGSQSDDYLSDSTGIGLWEMDLTSQYGASVAINILTDAIDLLASNTQEVGNHQSRLTSKEETVSTAILNTEATRSRIEDTDFAEEQMEIVKQQILQQTASTALTQSTQAPQSVLSLFQ